MCEGVEWTKLAQNGFQQSDYQLFNFNWAGWHSGNTADLYLGHQQSFVFVV